MSRIRWFSCDYTYYSTVPHTYSHIDFILRNSNALPFLLYSRHIPSSWLDHGSVLSVFNLTAPVFPLCSWRPNELLLTDTVIKTQTESYLHFYYQINATIEITLGILWMGHTKFITGSLIHLASLKEN